MKISNYGIYILYNKRYIIIRVIYTDTYKGKANYEDDGIL